MIEKDKPQERKILRGTAASLGTMVLLAAGAAGVTKLQEHRNPYGYDPARNPSAPTFLETHQGINPADLHTGDK